jgi:hypothetical protein
MPILPVAVLPAHYDGERICLDEKFDLKPDTRLIVTVLQEEEPDNDREDWLRLSAQTLEGAYGEDEPEYPADLLKEVNPSYEAR